MAQRAVSKQSNNALCKANSHSWIRSASDGYRYCHLGCGAIEQLRNGEWVRVDVVVQPKRKQAVKQTGPTLYDALGSIDVRISRINQ
jgi:hypothetical protein